MAYSNDFVANLLGLVSDIVSADKVEFSEMLYEQSFVDGDIADTHTIVPNVRDGQVIPILLDKPEPDSFPFVDDTSCATTDTAVTHEFSGHTWQVGLIESRVGICLRTFNENFLRFFNVYRYTRAGENEDEVLNDALVDFISGKFTQNLNLATWRASYFGDTGSGSAILNGIDGVFVQLDAAPADNKVTIAENDELTYTLQKSQLTGEDVLNYLDEMYETATEQPWFDDSVCEYRVTRSMGNKLVNWLNKLGDKAPTNCNCVDPETKVATRGFRIEGLTLNGMPVIVHNEWDKIINYSTQLNGGGADNARTKPHRAILTYREDILIGTGTVDRLNSFDIWHSKDDKKVYLEGSSQIGAGVPFPQEAIYAS
jgi:hypothetical protein